jgi:UDP-4-amino-4-deoxy-L-arabinose-oxoglutarate aminotransferase
VAEVCRQGLLHPTEELTLTLVPRLADLRDTAYANKVITTGEGGMLVGRRDLVHRARLLGRHGIDSSVWQRHGTRRTADYEVTAPGLKYVMSDLAAAVGLRQWRKLPDFTARRAEIAAAYTRALADLPGLATPTVLPATEPGWFSIFDLHRPRSCPAQP